MRAAPPDAAPAARLRRRQCRLRRGRADARSLRAPGLAVARAYRRARTVPRTRKVSVWREGNRVQRVGAERLVRQQGAVLHWSSIRRQGYLAAAPPARGGHGNGPGCLAALPAPARCGSRRGGAPHGAAGSLGRRRVPEGAAPPLGARPPFALRPTPTPWRGGPVRLSRAGGAGGRDLGGWGPQPAPRPRPRSRVAEPPARSPVSARRAAARRTRARPRAAASRWLGAVRWWAAAAAAAKAGAPRRSRRAARGRPARRRCEPCWKPDAGSGGGIPGILRHALPANVTVNSSVNYVVDVVSFHLR
jgi:hypothetical protein